MKKYCLSFLLAVCCIFAGFRTQAQLTIRGDVFLAGRFIEVGIATNGSIGSGKEAPLGYHPLDCSLPYNRIGIVADPDKDFWTVGSPAQIGDYTLPGVAVEGWSIQVRDSLVATAERSGGDSSLKRGLKGHNVKYYTTGKNKISLWEGAYAGLDIVQQAQIHDDKMHILFTVTLTNSTAATIHDIYYNRVIDADNEACQTGVYSTINTIENQLPDPLNHVAVSSRGQTYKSYLGLHTKDCRGKSYILKGSLTSTPLSLDTVYMGIGVAKDFMYGLHSTITVDAGIGIVFKLDSLAAGASTTISYGYVLDEAEIDDLISVGISALWKYKGTSYKNHDTISACDGSFVDLSLLAPGPGNWLWDASPFLATLSGPLNTIAVDDTNTFRAIRTSCGTPDTMYITVCGTPLIKPILSRSGSSISVSPSGYISYQWYKDNILIPGATIVPYIVSASGKYFVQATDANGCVSNSDTIDVSILSLNEPASAQYIRVFPNPASSLVQIAAPFPVQVTLTDLSGRVLLHTKEMRELDLSSFADGLYLLRIAATDGRMISTQKLLKQKDL